MTGSAVGTVKSRTKLGRKPLVKLMALADCENPLSATDNFVAAVIGRSRMSLG